MRKTKTPHETTSLMRGFRFHFENITCTIYKRRRSKKARTPHETTSLVRGSRKLAKFNRHCCILKHAWRCNQNPLFFQSWGSGSERDTTGTCTHCPSCNRQRVPSARASNINVTLRSHARRSCQARQATKARPWRPPRSQKTQRGEP